MKTKRILWYSLLAYVALVSAYPDNPDQPPRPLLNLKASGGRLEDPANPVAAAATDPNEAAMNIKSRDLLPSNRADIHPHHRDPPPSEGRRHNDGDDDDDDDESGGKPSRNGNRKGGNNNQQQKHSSKNRGNEPENDDGGDDEGSNQTKGKSGKSASKDKNKKSSSSSQPKSKNKTTHTGIDGKEVADDDEDGDASKKKVKVKHVQSKKHRWRTGKPKYDYKKALAGWKEVGPMYYYKGKYANDAVATAAATSAYILLVYIPFVALMGYFY